MIRVAIVRSISGLLLVGAASMFVCAAQMNAHPAPAVHAAPALAAQADTGAAIALF